MWLFGFLPRNMVAWQSECVFLLFDEGPLRVCDEMNINCSPHNVLCKARFLTSLCINVVYFITNYMFSKLLIENMFTSHENLNIQTIFLFLYLFSENKHRYEYVKINFGYREKVKHAVRMRYIWFFLKVVLLGVVLISCHCELKA